MVAEFQGFARDFHDLAVEKAVELSGALPRHRPLLTAAATEGRLLDRGNADLRSLKTDFKGVGISNVPGEIATRKGYWAKTRTARALDQVVWNHLMTAFNSEPW